MLTQFQFVVMPVNGSSASSSNAPGGANRTTFRPPWVKEGPQPIPMPAQGQAWRRDSSMFFLQQTLGKNLKIKQIFQQK